MSDLSIQNRMLGIISTAGLIGRGNSSKSSEVKNTNKIEQQKNAEQKVFNREAERRMAEGKREESTWEKNYEKNRKDLGKQHRQESNDILKAHSQELMNEEKEVAAKQKQEQKDIEETVKQENKIAGREAAEEARKKTKEEDAQRQIETAKKKAEDRAAIQVQLDSDSGKTAERAARTLKREEEANFIHQQSITEKKSRNAKFPNRTKGSKKALAEQAGQNAINELENLFDTKQNQNEAMASIKAMAMDPEMAERSKQFENNMGG